MPEALTIRDGSWTELGETASEIRRVVFIEEQQVPQEEEWDGRDHDCRHFLAVDTAGQTLGTARLLPDGHIGRVAVLSEARGRGVGLALMEAVIASARHRGDKKVMLAAQIQALAFYARQGFVAEDDTFMEAGIPHRNMTLSLQN